MRTLLRYLGIRTAYPCAGCGSRNLWAFKHGDWCFYRVLFGQQHDDGADW